MKYLITVKDVAIGEEIEGITFGERKASYVGKTILVNESKVKDTYILSSKRYIFKKDWVDLICELQSDMVIYLRSRMLIPLKVKANSLYTLDDKLVINNIDNSCAQNYGRIFFANDFEYNEFPEGYTYNTTLEKCKDCGELLNPALLVNGTCFKCIDSQYSKCSMCGNTFHNKGGKKILTDRGEKYVCPSCEEGYKRCKKCNILIVGSQYTINGDAFCTKCKETMEVSTCFRCGKSFSKDTKVKLITTKDGRIECEFCNFVKRMSNTSGGIYDYGFKPNPVFYGKGTQMYFGFEIETLSSLLGRSDKYTDHLATFLQFKMNESENICYCKFDRSIGNDGRDGFEIVTHPMSWDFINSDEGKDIIKNILSIKNYGCNSFYNNYCGMHIHISKKVFTSVILHNFLAFIFKNKDFCIKISERTDINKVDTFCCFDVVDSVLSDMASRMSNVTGDRHIAVNITSNTVEVRIFRGTLNYRRFMKNVEFCKALFEYCKLDSFSISSEKFKEFVYSNKSQYSNLNEFLEK